MVLVSMDVGGWSSSRLPESSVLTLIGTDRLSRFTLPHNPICDWKEMAVLLRSYTCLSLRTLSSSGASQHLRPDHVIGKYYIPSAAFKSVIVIKNILVDLHWIYLIKKRTRKDETEYRNEPKHNIC